jgi:hypothetical protein
MNIVLVSQDLSFHLTRRKCTEMYFQGRMFVICTLLPIYYKFQEKRREERDRGRAEREGEMLQMTKTKNQFPYGALCFFFPPLEKLDQFLTFSAQNLQDRYLPRYFYKLFFHI